MLRITGGELKGRRLKTPKGDHTRPTTGRVKESLLGKLTPRLPGARMLDLFAGSGQMGFEALSRGAESVIAVEKDRNTARLLHQNAEALGLPPGRFRLVSRPVEALIKTVAGPFDIIFLDPPYGYANLPALVSSLRPLLAEDGLMVVEQGREDTPVEADEEKSYGDTVLRFIYGRAG